MKVAHSANADRATYGDLAGTSGFTGLLAIVLTNVLGMSLQIFALSVLVYARTGSALWSSVTFAAGFLPQLFGGALLTSLADRWPARSLIAGGAAIRAAVATLLAFADLPPAAAIAAVAVVAVLSPVPSAAQSALVARLLSGELYVLGRSVFNLVSSAAQLLGLALGGAVVAAVGPRAAIAIAGGVQMLGLLSVATLPATARTTTAAGRWHPGETWSGNAALLRDPVVRHILLSWWLPTGLLVGAEALVVAYVGEHSGSATSTGQLLAAFPAGAAVGDLICGRWLTPASRRRIVPWLLTAMGVGLLPFAWQPPTAVAAVCLAGAAAGTAYQLGGQRMFLDAVPTTGHGLAFGLLSTGVMASQGIGPLLSGVLADALGAGPTITALGCAILLITVFLGRLPA